MNFICKDCIFYDNQLDEQCTALPNKRSRGPSDSACLLFAACPEKTLYVEFPVLKGFFYSLVKGSAFEYILNE